MNPETKLQNEIMVAMSELGAIPYRMQVGLFYSKNAIPIHIGLTGTPDLLIIAPDSTVLWYEIKTKTGRLSKGQSEFATTLKSMGHRVYTVRSVTDAITIYENEVLHHA